MPEKIAACVVLYHPKPDVIENIQSYYPHVDYLIVVDNSEKQNIAIETLMSRHFERLIYKPLNNNLGIAAALNIGCDIAIQKGMNWILTMDQDSIFLQDNLPVMISDIAEIESRYGKAGIVTPYHVLTQEAKKNFESKFEVKKIAMTSGNLLNLKAYQACGIFDEKLFMDFVDYEYCLRLRKHGYSIIQDNNAKLIHALGNFQMRPLLHKKIAVSHHNYQRRYYMTRNSLYTAFKYLKTDIGFFLITMYNNYLLSPFVILFYEANKMKKIKSICTGTFDFIRGIYGKRFRLKQTD